MQHGVMSEPDSASQERARSADPAAPRHESVQAASGRRRREASAERILAATRLLLRRGQPVAQLSVGRIITEAGVSRATFYACFRDKHAVIAGLAQQSLAWRDDVSAEALADPALTRSTLDDLMRAVVTHWRANRVVLAAIVELAEHDPAIQSAWRAAISEIATQTAGHLRARWRDSPDAPDDPDAVATATTWMFERCCHQLVVDDASAETVALAISEILWRTATYRSAGAG